MEMFVYDVAVTFVLDHSSVTVGVQVESDSSDFEIDEEVAIDAARDALDGDGVSIPESIPIGIDVEIQGLYGEIER